MVTLKVKLNAVTPMFLRGADNRTPELRAASFRGALRYWLRALIGIQYGDNLTGLARAESIVFGSTAGASPITIRTRSEGYEDLKVGKRRALPHSGDPRKQFSPDAFVEGSTFALELVTRPGQAVLPDQSLASLLLFVNLGGIGNRARRGFGSLQVDSLQTSRNMSEEFVSNIEPLLAPGMFTDGAALATHIEKVLTWSLSRAGAAGTSAYSADTIPAYPRLHSDHAKVLVCRHAFDGSHYHQAMIDFWDRLRQQKYRAQQDAFGFAKGKRRRASPLHLHIAKSNEGYHLVITAMRAGPKPLGRGERGAEGWRLVSEFLQERADAWDGVFLLGKEKTW